MVAGVQPFNPKDFISQVVAYLDKQEPTPELNCLRLTVLCGIRPELLVSLHTSQVDDSDDAITAPVRTFFRRTAPKASGYFFPAGTSHTTLGAVQVVWKELYTRTNICGPNGSEPTLELLAWAAVRVLSQNARA